METVRLMLDTTAISAFFREHEEISEYISSADELHINPIVIGELLAGFGLGKREQKNRRILDQFLSSPRVHVNEIDAGSSERYARIFGHLRRTSNPIPTNDLWIAASAMQYGLKLLTMDKHYLNIPQIIAVYCEP
jgi:tRNA(fMet)-specific endonuclease VapC